MILGGCSFPYQEAQVALSRGEYEQAIIKFQETEKEEPYLLTQKAIAGAFYNNFGNAYAKLNNLDLAYSCLLKSVNAWPARGYYAYGGLADIEYKWGNLNKAFEYEEKAYNLAYTDEYYKIEKETQSFYSPLTIQKKISATYDYYKMALNFSLLKRLYEQRNYKEVQIKATEILNNKYRITLGIDHTANIVDEVTTGSIADINGITIGDKILELDGIATENQSLDFKGMDPIKIKPTADYVSLSNAIANIYDKFSQTVNIKIKRNNRIMDIKCYLYYPELETAKRMLDEANVALSSGKYKKYASDIDPPQLIILNPNIQRGTKVVSQNNIEIVVLASDNFQIEKVMANTTILESQQADLSEKRLLNGEVKKYTAQIALNRGKNSYTIKAIDTSGNIAKKEISIEYNPEIKQQKQQLYDRSIAVVIGINNYTTWPSLEFAVSDAEAIKNKLYEQGFDQVFELTDKAATRIQILKLLSDELPRILKENDRLLIYFAGHGQTENFETKDESGKNITEKEGYIIAVDSELGNYRGSAISMTKIREITKGYKAKHVLYAFDSCYSGLGLKRFGGTNKADGYIQKLSTLKAVQILTAGGENEQVGEENGHGIFTKYLILALSGKADLDNDGFVTASEIGTYIRPEVSRISKNSQTPKFGWISGEGDFIFDESVY
jgi:tetratricopeptide (TPR) repeat protein